LGALTAVKHVVGADEDHLGDAAAVVGIDTVGN
jgi:hypothetical protein